LDPESGQKTELYQEEGGLRGLAVSPDGRWLTFIRDLDSLVVMPSVGGELREVIHFGEGEVMDPINFVRWMPDGEHLLFYKYKKGLWKVHVETGAQQQIGPAIENLLGASIHPDGKQIAFTVHQEGSQLWVIENFLPE
jgi:Tol biopolymer transport system component